MTQNRGVLGQRPGIDAGAVTRPWCRGRHPGIDAEAETSIDTGAETSIDTGADTRSSCWGQTPGLDAGAERGQGQTILPHYQLLLCPH